MNMNVLFLFLFFIFLRFFLKVALKIILNCLFIIDFEIILFRIILILIKSRKTYITFKKDVLLNIL